jgi:hypothetical protein
LQRILLKIKALPGAHKEGVFKGTDVLGIELPKFLNLVNFLLASLPEILHIIIMQHPTLTLIIRYPNDTLHLATQDHLKNKLIVKCESCGQMEVIDRGKR